MRDLCFFLLATSTKLSPGISACSGSFLMCTSPPPPPRKDLDVFGRKAMWSGLIEVHFSIAKVAWGSGGGVCTPCTCVHTLPCTFGNRVGEAGFIFVFNY